MATQEIRPGLVTGQEAEVRGVLAGLRQKAADLLGSPRADEVRGVVDL